MATKQITTWVEFKTALTETITENTTYEIMNDIDVSDEVIENRITIPASNYIKTFQPVTGIENAKINGITTYLNTGANNDGLLILSKNAKIVFNNISFTNIMAQSCALFNTKGTNTLIFNNCFINGVMSVLCSAFGGFTLNRCSINIKCNYAFYRGAPTMDNNYIIIKPLDDNSFIYAYNMISSMINIGSNNYFGGKVMMTTSITFNNYGTNNVYNWEMIYSNNPATLTIASKSLDGDTVVSKGSLINIDKIKNKNGAAPTVTVSNTGFPYTLTDTQIKSRTYIQQNTNFPLYG